MVVFGELVEMIWVNWAKNPNLAGYTSYHSIRSRKLMENWSQRAKAVGTINGEAETYCLKDNGLCGELVRIMEPLNKVEIVNSSERLSVAGMDRKSILH